LNAERIQTFWRFIRPFRWQLAMLLVLTSLISFASLMPPLITRSIIDRVLTRGRTDLFLPLGIALLTVPALLACSRLIQHIWIAGIGQQLVLRIRAAVFDHLLTLSLRYFDANSSGKTVSRLMEDSAVIQNMVTATSVQIISDLVTATIAVVVTFTINWQLAILLLAVAVIFAINYRLNKVRLRVTSRRYRQSQDRLAGGLTNRLTGSLTVKTYGAEAREHLIFQAQSDEAAILFEDAAAANNSFNLNTTLLQGLSHALVFFAGCGLVLRGSATYGDVVAFTAYAMQLLMPAVHFSMIAQQFQNVGVSADRLFEILEQPPEIASRRGAAPAGRVRGDVVLDHVAFGYNPETSVLHDINLHVTAGHTVALVGPTGCGKSTILSLLLRFYDVTDGAIRIDGRDVRDFPLQDLRRQFGIVLQESLLFNTTVAENIRYARPGASLDAVRRAAAMAEIDAEIMALPDGYDTLLGSRGVELSTGQRQRVSIARAILADPPMLIMDEATSSLDSDSEVKIQTAIGRFLKGRTAFIVAHRLSTIRDAGTIVLLDRGRIREQGTHDELVAIPDGRYRHLYERHAGAGVLDEQTL